MKLDGTWITLISALAPVVYGAPLAFAFKRPRAYMHIARKARPILLVLAVCMLGAYAGAHWVRGQVATSSSELNAFVPAECPRPPAVSIEWLGWTLLAVVLLALVNEVGNYLAKTLDLVPEKRGLHNEADEQAPG